MKRRKAKNKQAVFSLVLILALAALVLVVQFDPSGKFSSASQLTDAFDASQSETDTVDSTTAGDESQTQNVFDGTTNAGTQQTVNQPPQIIIDPQDLTDYSTQNVEADADHSLNWPATQTSFSIHFKVEDAENDPVGLPSATDATGNALSMAMSIARPEYPNLIVLTETPTNPITIRVTENPKSSNAISLLSRLKVYVYGGPQAPTINPVLDIYLEDDPDFNSGPYPVGENIVFNVENSTVDGVIINSNVSSALNVLWTFPDGSTAPAPRAIKSFSNIELQTVSVNLFKTAVPASETETVEIELYNGLNAILSTPEDGDEITLGTFTEFREESTSLSEPITLWTLDLGDESEPWGYLGVRINQQACFSATDATVSCVTGLIKDSDAIGDPCACSSEVSRIYPTTTVETTVPPGIRYHTYETVDDCGDDFTCTVNLTVSTASYSESETVDLKFNQEDVCEAHPTLDECQPAAPPPNPCIANPNMIGCQSEPEGTIDSDFDPLTTDTTGQNNYVAQDPPPSEDDFDPLESLGDEPPEEPEGTGIGKIVLILILLSALGGAGYYMWKRGMFSKLKIPGKAKAKPVSTTSPIQTYIAKAKAAGESNVVIRQNLKNSGWPEEEINKHLK